MNFTLAGESVPVRLERIEPDGTFEAVVGTKRFEGSFTRITDGMLHLQIGERARLVHLATDGATTEVFLEGRVWRIEEGSPKGKGRGRGDAPGVSAPMPSVVTRILVEVGAQVAAGDPLLVVSAMKMEHTLTAPHAGIVRAIHATLDAQVMPGIDLVEIEPVTIFEKKL